MYADYTYYTQDYYGFNVPIEKFNYYQKQSSDYIDYVIGKTLTGDEITSNVKDCSCALCDYLFNRKEKYEKKSESVKGYSVTFSENVSTVESEGNGKYKIVVEYLSSTGLLNNRGVIC